MEEGSAAPSNNALKQTKPALVRVARSSLLTPCSTDVDRSCAWQTSSGKRATAET